MIGPGGDFKDMLDYFLPAIPYILAWLGVCIVTIVFWRRHPMPSLLVLLAAILNLLGWTLFNWLQYWLPMALDEDGWLGEMMIWVRTGMEVAAIVLIVVAVFGWRGERRPEEYRPY